MGVDGSYYSVATNYNVEKMNGDGTFAWLDALSKTVEFPLVLDTEGEIGGRGVVKTTFVRERAPMAEHAQAEARKQLVVSSAAGTVSHRHYVSLSNRAAALMTFARHGEAFRVGRI